MKRVRSGLIERSAVMVFLAFVLIVGRMRSQAEEPLLTAADVRGMAIILGLFYQRQDQILEDETAVCRGVRNALSWVQERGDRNVLIEIANEYRHPGFGHRILFEKEGEAVGR